MALAFTRHSSYSFSGIDLAVIALPTEKDTYLFFELLIILRMITLKSNFPCVSKNPTAPLYNPLLNVSCSSIIFIAVYLGAPVILPIGNKLFTASTELVSDGI